MCTCGSYCLVSGKILIRDGECTTLDAAVVIEQHNGLAREPTAAIAPDGGTVQLTPLASETYIGK